VEVISYNAEFTGVLREMYCLLIAAEINYHKLGGLQCTYLSYNSAYQKFNNKLYGLKNQGGSRTGFVQLLWEDMTSSFSSFQTLSQSLTYCCHRAMMSHQPLCPLLHLLSLFGLSCLPPLYDRDPLIHLDNPGKSPSQKLQHSHILQSLFCNGR
jgi:hypothetical protein